MFKGIQSKEYHDNNPVHSNFIYQKLFPFNEINENVIPNREVVKL